MENLNSHTKFSITINKLCGMSIQSLLYHGFGLKDIEYLRTEYEGGDIIFHICTKADKLCCSSCGSSNVMRKGKINRKLKTVGIGLKPVYLR